jgi:hypothetical protein
VVRKRKQNVETRLEDEIKTLGNQNNCENDFPAHIV